MEKPEVSDQQSVGTFLIKRSVVLEMAHRLPNHAGKCRNIHGHSWSLTVSVVGTVKDNTGKSDEGMVVDFSILKDALKRIESVFDHSLVLSAGDTLIDLLNPEHEFTIPYPGLCLFECSYGPVWVVPYAPTSENLARLWGEILVRWLPELQVTMVTVKETANSEVNWCPNEVGF